MIDALIRPYFLLLPHDIASVAAAMVWGQKTALTQDMYDVFKVTGLVHLLVLSGQNITLLLGFFAGLEKKIGYKIKAILTIIIAAFYLALFRDPPILRAVCMASIASLALIFNAPISGLWAFIITVTGLLIVYPQWITSVSFLLSAGATLGILLFYLPIRSWLLHIITLRKDIVVYCIDAGALTLSAQIFTTPLLLAYFRELSLFSIPMNIAVGWLIEPIMVFGVIESVLYHVYAPLAMVGAYILFGLINALLIIVRVGSVVASLCVIHI
ncbi:MAG: ComEC/Rec2 family competence protein [Candidatus Roizmanbacteria bacterium]|nr:ComEC/Rec2 family competence protein [Candidatus Roizmanbacteria bacterium]